MSSGIRLGIVRRIAAILALTATLASAGQSAEQDFSASDPRLYIVGTSTYGAKGGFVMPGDEPIAMTSTEYSVLEVLLREAGHVVSKGELSERALGRQLTRYDRSIDMHLSSLRKKLGSWQPPPPRTRTERRSTSRTESLDEAMAEARAALHAYYACVSFVDDLVGTLLDELDRLELSGNTIVVLWGDHGWNLGEHTLWCKHCCYETSMHAPLIVRAPGIDGGKTTAGLTEFIDIYPSLCELAGIPLPTHLQGRSFVPLMKQTNRPWKDAAIGRFGSGDTIRTDTLRFTEYTDRKGKFLARMLYDHSDDPGENVNVAENDGRKGAVIKLTEKLHRGMGRDDK